LWVAWGGGGLLVWVVDDGWWWNCTYESWMTRGIWRWDGNTSVFSVYEMRGRHNDI
jgi:hypothetical protein